MVESLMETQERQLNRELRKARRASMDHTPATTVAKTLVEALATEIEAQEVRGNKRQEKGRAKLRDAVGRILGDLVIALDYGRSPWVWHENRPEAFTGEKVGRESFNLVRGHLEKAGLVKLHRGHFNRTFGHGFAGRFQGTPAFVELVRGHGLAEGKSGLHFKPDEQASAPVQVLDPIRLKRPSRWCNGEKIPGEPLPVSLDDPRVRELADEVTELNDFLAQVELRGGIHRGYWRGFNEGTKEGYGWNKGGRLYSIGEFNYQGLKPTARDELTIDGEPVEEIDITASHLTILAGYYRKSLPRRSDPYRVKGLPRGVVKAWITITLSRGTFGKNWPEDTPEKISRYPIAQVQELVVAALPGLSGWISRRGMTWADLQFRESQAIVATMLHLKRERGVPCYSVFDSIIVPKQHRALATAVLTEEFCKATGVAPRLKSASPKAEMAGDLLQAA